uniref:Guanine nucleotide-binding protein subunit beta-like protein n=3 Tax=Melanaphis sacchari TaxID=742174 RepID=A0A2H8TJ14_9HEMI
MTRNVNPGLEGIMQALCLSPDNRYAAAYTNNNQTVLLNCLTSEFIVIENPFENGETVSGVNMLNTHLFVHGSFSLCRYDLRGNLESKITTNEDPNQWVLMSVKFITLTCNRFIFWSGRMDDTRMMMQTTKDNNTGPKFYFHSAMAINKEETRLYCCPTKNSYDISQFDFIDNEWKLIKNLKHIGNCTVLQIKLSEDSSSLLGTISNGFCIWDLSLDGTKVLHLPHGVRNITINMMQSNSCMLSADKRFLVAGVRKMLYVWNMETELLIKVLDAHFGRIISLLPLTTGNWNSVITSSIDRSVKVWNINNIFEQVHVIDRHELQIDSISLSHSGLAATVTRGCVGIWDINTGRLIQQLADNLLGAIVTQALITPDGKYIVCSESGNLLIWNRILCRVIFKQQQPGIQQIMLLDEATKCLTVSKQEEINVETQQNIDATAIVRSIPDGKCIYSFDYQVRNVTGMEFKELVVTADGLNLIALASDKGHREALHIFNASNGEYVTKIVLKQSGMKDIMFIVAMPHRANLVAVINPDKGMLFDIRTKKFLKSIPKWGGFCTKDGKYGLYAPTRGGLELLELKKGSSVKTFIPRVAEGVFTVICMFNKTDEYVLYYHSGKKTLRVFRLTDAKMLANYRVPAELSAIETTEDGRAVVIATVDGCLTVLAIADPIKDSFLSALPSRDETWKKKMDKQRTAKLFKAAAAITKFCVSVNESNLKEEVGNSINSSQLILSKG